MLVVAQLRLHLLRLFSGHYKAAARGNTRPVRLCSYFVVTHHSQHFVSCFFCCMGILFDYPTHGIFMSRTFLPARVPPVYLP